MPARLFPAKGVLALKDFEKVFYPDPRAGDIFDMHGIDRAAGAMVLVRPDQYVANVFPLDETEALAHQLISVFTSG